MARATPTTTRSAWASSPRPSSCATPAWSGRSAARRCAIPTTSRARCARQDGAIALEASHDGYAERWGLIHTRTLKLDAAGTRLEGCGPAGPAKGLLRFSWDVPFAIHFHLHPAAEARVGASPETAELLLEQRRALALTAAGATVSIEEGLYFAEAAGACTAHRWCCGHGATANPRCPG